MSCLNIRVAPLRMGVGRAAPGSQVLTDFEVLSCPWSPDAYKRDLFVYVYRGCIVSLSHTKETYVGLLWGLFWWTTQKRPMYVSFDEPHKKGLCVCMYRVCVVSLSHTKETYVGLFWWNTQRRHMCVCAPILCVKSKMTPRLFGLFRCWTVRDRGGRGGRWGGGRQRDDARAARRRSNSSRLCLTRGGGHSPTHTHTHTPYTRPTRAGVPTTHTHTHTHTHTQESPPHTHTHTPNDPAATAQTYQSHHNFGAVWWNGRWWFPWVLRQCPRQ